jgi:integrase
VASAFLRGSKWYVRFRDNRGRWSTKAVTAQTKTEAKRMAVDIDRLHERQRLGLEPMPPEDGGGTVGDLLRWWLHTYSRTAPSHLRNVSTVEKHLLPAPIAAFTLTELRPGHIETFLQSRADTHSPQTINHLRRFLLTAYNCAIRAGRFTGINPAAAVRRRKVPKRKPDFLRAEEVPVLLNALQPRWRALFATAVYTGLRKGELLGLRKSDLDFPNGLIMVSRSYDRDTNKGLKEEAVPMAAELVPFLRQAVAESPSDLVFPRPDGSMMPEDAPLEVILRAALARAGMVQGYSHVCRKKDCGHAEDAADTALRRCPTHGMKLWPKAIHRRIRFHDLRHTTASLLLMAGANPAAVQRILRHSDPRITTEVYGHLLPGYLRDEINRLSFGVAPISPTASESSPSQANAAAARELATYLLQGPSGGDLGADGGPPDPSDHATLNLWARRDSNPRPSASEADGGGPAVSRRKKSAPRYLTVREAVPQR